MYPVDAIKVYQQTSRSVTARVNQYSDPNANCQPHTSSDVFRYHKRCRSNIIYRRRPFIMERDCERGAGCWYVYVVCMSSLGYEHSESLIRNAYNRVFSQVLLMRFISEHTRQLSKSLAVMMDRNTIHSQLVQYRQISLSRCAVLIISNSHCRSLCHNCQ